MSCLHPLIQNLGNRMKQMFNKNTAVSEWFQGKAYSNVNLIHGRTHSVFDVSGFPTRGSCCGELCSLYNRNSAKLAAVWCLELCAGTYLSCCWNLVLLWALSAAFWQWFLVGGIECCALLSCGLFLRLLKLHQLGVCKLDLSRGGLNRCHSVLDHGLNLHRNIPLSGWQENTIKNTLCNNQMQTFQRWCWTQLH